MCGQLCDAGLLPRVSARDQGKICVVIDLDETLVHSSFKVGPRSTPLPSFLPFVLPHACASPTAHSHVNIFDICFNILMGFFFFFIF